MTARKITEITGRGIAIRGNDIDTDRIIPARFLKEITFENMGKYAFYDERFDESGKKKNHPFNDEKFKGASILVVNKNFGCGSSREHAPQSLMRFGIRAIVGESFAEIFSGNCSMLGIPTCSLNSKEILELMDYVERNPQGQMELNINSAELGYGNKKITVNIDSSLRDSLLNGTWDTTSMMLESKGKIFEVASNLPYFNRFDL